MNGRRAKQIRRLSKNPQLSEETKYGALQHKRTMYQPVPQEDGSIAYEPVGVIRIQIVMQSCQRQQAKIWKARYKHFQHRSDTLPYRGFNANMGG